ncbi:MAG: hypothetical protein NWE80_00150 [Candidatus Bathyarchaeota archaeon]|nr:hypothetical protein [Candidatus Bathyarchaeota archaeon]
MSRNIWISLITVVVIGLGILFALYANDNASSSRGVKPRPDKILTIDPQFLSRPPHFPNNGRPTKIFLESATLWHDYSNVSFRSDGSYYAYDGVPAVVVNATIRNDYIAEEIIKFSQGGSSDCSVGIDLHMYDEQGDPVGTVHSGDPFWGCCEINLKSGESTSVNMVFATENIIDHFNIYVSYLSPIP